MIRFTIEIVDTKGTCSIDAKVDGTPATNQEEQIAHLLRAGLAIVGDEITKASAADEVRIVEFREQVRKRFSE